MTFNRILLTMFLLGASALGSCPTTVPCPIDGKPMRLAYGTCHYNRETGHKVCRFEHETTERGEWVTHYEYVDCDE